MKKAVLFFVLCLMMTLKLATGYIDITIEVKPVFFENEKIYFDYILLSNEDVDLTLASNVRCEDITSAIEEKRISIKKDIPLSQSYEFTSTGSVVEPQECIASVIITEPEYEYEEESFEIAPRSTFGFDVYLCKDRGCESESKEFFLNENLFIDYESEQETDIMFILKKPNQEVMEVSVDEPIILTDLGVYSLFVMSVEDGYKLSEEEIMFSVTEFIEREPEKTETSSSVMLIPLIFAAFIMLILVFWRLEVYRNQTRKNEELKKIKYYIKANLNRGYSKADIISKLRKVGFGEELINKALKK